MTTAEETAEDATAEARDALLRDAGWTGAAASPLAGDASARRYERLSGGPAGASAVLMIASGAGGTRRFTALTSHLRDLGFSAPEILAADHAAGLLLLEDLGDDLFARVALDRPELEERIYERAVDLLATLAQVPPPTRLVEDGHATTVPPYDAEFLSFEAALFREWWLPAARGAALSADAATEFDALVASACAPFADERGALVLRDYHAENLIWLPDRPGLRSVGLLDYQDARRGHAAYDLVSLLEDARRDLRAGLADRMFSRYTLSRSMSAEDGAAFHAAYSTLGAQRNLKIIGIFARLWLRDGKPGYLGMIPRVWRHLSHDLAHPALKELRNWVEAHAPEPTSDAISRVQRAREAPQ